VTEASANPRVLYIIVCAAPPARDVNKLVEMCQQQGWDVCTILTPKALAFTDAKALATLTGHPVRSEYKHPEEPDVLPPPDAMLVAPATFNTINKWALGIADTLALGLLTEGIGKSLPIVALPSLNTAQAKHPAWTWSVERLRDCGVHILYGPGGFEPVDPGSGNEFLPAYPWERASAVLAELTS
jgi:phosphopantothenoylcysteine synthetase/decarboxylase